MCIKQNDLMKGNQLIYHVELTSGETKTKHGTHDAPKYYPYVPHASQQWVVNRFTVIAHKANDFKQLLIFIEVINRPSERNESILRQ